MIYLDNAATTLRKPEAVIEAVADAMRNMGNSGRGSGSILSVLLCRGGGVPRTQSADEL